MRKDVYKKEICKNWARIMQICHAIIKIKHKEEESTMSDILQTSHLCKTIGGKQLVEDVNIHIKKGEIYGFLGPNGA